MQLKVFSIFDSKVGVYSNPFFCRSKGEALRTFGDLANDPQSRVCHHPGDFTLFELGEFEDNTAVILSHEALINLGCAIEFKSEVSRV